MTASAIDTDSVSPPGDSLNFLKKNATVLQNGSTDATIQEPADQPLPTRRSPHEEGQYLDLIKDILTRGEHRPDRTGTGTLSLFAPPQLRFSLSKPDPASSSGERIPVVPLLTTKRVFLRAVTTE